MHVLITGAAGRIGSVLAAGLTARHRLRLTDLRPGTALPDGCEFTAGDITSDADVEALCAGVDAVIHLAGHPNSRDWAEVSALNFDASRRVFEAAAAAGARRLVYASSIHVAGFAPATADFADDVELLPDGPYGVSKAAAEMALRHVCARHAIAGVALRIGSFRPAPGNARELRTWISPADMVRLAEASLSADVSGFNAAWGLSNNRRARIERGVWERLGYRPRDDAEDHAEALAAAGIDLSVVSEWPYLGGSFALPPP